MATTLTAAISADDLIIYPSNDEVLSGKLPHHVQIEDEVLYVSGPEYVGNNAQEATRWAVERGMEGTTAASHTAGLAITAASGGGGAAEAGTVVELLTGTQTTYGQLYRGDVEPTVPAPVEGDYWIDTSGGLPYQHKVLESATWVVVPLLVKDASGDVLARVTVGDGWALQAIVYSPSDPLLSRAQLTLDGDGNLNLTTYDALGDNDTNISMGLGSIVFAVGKIVMVLPTVNPADGSLWNDAGVVKVSA